MPFIGLLILLAVLIAMISEKFFSHHLPLKFWFDSSKIWRNLTIILISLALVEYSLTNYFILGHLPHVPDAIAYTNQAKLFAQGKFYLETNQFSKHFPLVGMINYQGKQFSQYTFGHPLILSLGYLIGLPWLIPPLMGGLALILIYQIGCQIYSLRIGFLVTSLAFISPFIKMNSASFMSHNTALVFTLLAVLFFIKLFKTQRPIYSLFTGLVLGFLVNTRPFTGFLVALPLGFFSLKYLFSQPKKLWQNLVLFWPISIGLIAMLDCYLGYNKILTGSFITTTYDLGFVSQFGIDSNRTLAMALSDVYANLFLLDKVLLGWPFGLGFLFVLIYGLTPIIRKWEYLFIGLILAIIGGYFFYKGSWMMYGPRFWYETTPFWLFLLVAGIEKFPLFIKKLVPSVLKINLEFKSQLILIMVYTLIICLSILSLKNWYQVDLPARWQADFTPENLGELKDFNYANDHLISKITKLKLKQAVIFLKPGINWWEYGVPSYFMDLTFQDEIIYALDLGDAKNSELISQYPNRTFIWLTMTPLR
jgi:hypothetical protein